jgi:hypothetical protein
MVHTRVHPWLRVARLGSLCGILLGLFFTGLGCAGQAGTGEDHGERRAPLAQ